MKSEDWSAGYMPDVAYTFGYQREINPLSVQLALRNAGIACPEFTSACELGYGQGVSVNFHAAASDVQWCGTDFNAAQAAFAQEMARSSGAGARLFDDPFADFCGKPDLPDFDYIALHGIWSWISDENRAVIVDFVRRKLKAGGVLYISYNTLPGWAPASPIRHLLFQHAEVMGAQGKGIKSRIDAALDFTEKLLGTNPAFARADPRVAARVGSIRRQDPQYVAHEFFNGHSRPYHFADMAKSLAPAKLGFACSASYLEHVESINLSAEQRELLDGIPDEQFRQSARDFMVNQHFRKDYWVKGVRKLNRLERIEGLRAQRLLLTVPRAGVSLTFRGALGEFTMSEPIYGPILDALGDHQPKTVAQLEEAVRNKGVNFDQLLQAVVVLAGAGHLTAAQDDTQVAKAKRSSVRLNAYLMHKARDNPDVGYLCSPVSGGAVPVGRFTQIFLLAASQGKKLPAEWAQFAWQVLMAQGERVVKDGKALESAEDNLKELNAMASTVAQNQVPILKALQIA